MKDDIRNGINVTLPNYNFCLDEARAVGTRTNEIETLSWVKVRNILKSMKRKYEIEKCHKRFERFVAESKRMWRLDKTRSL